MLTRSQIQRIAQRNGIGMQVQERDYVQHLLLWLLYSRSQGLVFKGGTALRVVYGGNRYSEDLDFNGPADVDATRALWAKVISGLLDFGIAAESRNEWTSEVGYSFDVSFCGPLWDGRDRSKGKVRVDVNRRQEPVETCRELVTSDYADVRPFVVTALTSAHLMAEKIRALVMRGKARDLYDVWLLLHQGIAPDQDLIEQKLSTYGIEWSTDLLTEALRHVGTEWERDLRHLLAQMIPYEVAHERVVERLARSRNM